jgi:hypothetical protein
MACTIVLPCLATACNYCYSEAALPNLFHVCLGDAFCTVCTSWLCLYDFTRQASLSYTVNALRALLGRWLQTQMRSFNGIKETLTVLFPGRVFNFDAIATPDGSTIVGKTTGSIYVTNVNDFSFPATHDILKPRLPISTNYMYSNLVWLQADSGLTWDIVTCRVLIESGE